jgi:hypothetical protein
MPAIAAELWNGLPELKGERSMTSKHPQDSQRAAETFWVRSE